MGCEDNISQNLSATKNEFEMYTTLGKSGTITDFFTTLCGLKTKRKEP